MKRARIVILLAFCWCGAVMLSNAAVVFASESVEIVVTGVKGDALENVKAALALPEGIVREGKVNPGWLEHFKGQVNGKARIALEPFGYYGPRISVDLKPVGDGKVRIEVHIDAGRPVRVTEVNVRVRGSGAGEEKLRALIREFPLRRGDVLLHRSYEEAKGALKAQALDLGYLASDFEEKRILVSEKERTAKIELELETGPRYFFGRTVFKDVTGYPEKFLRRYLTYSEGEVFSYRKIGETQINLVNSERFKEVIISPEKDKAEDLRVPMVVALKEAPPKHLRVGLGYGTDTGGRFSLKYSDLNVLKKGNEVRSELNMAQRIQAIAATYVIPSLKDTNSFDSVRLDLKKEDVQTYETKLLSLEVGRSVSFGKGMIGTAYIKALQEESSIASQSPKAFLVLPGIRFSQRQYDNLIRPTSGFHYALELRGTHECLGSDLALLQLLAGGSVIVSLPWRLSFVSRIQSGWTLEDKALKELPASIRFFAGGDKSVRGYAFQSLGPKDRKGEVIGGKNLIAGSLEIERAVFSDWGVAVFYDAGNAFNSFSGVRLCQGLGAGVRYYTKVGPVKLDIARRVGVSNPGFRIHFGFGFDL